MEELYYYSERSNMKRRKDIVAAAELKKAEEGGTWGNSGLGQCSKHKAMSGDSLERQRTAVMHVFHKLKLNSVL